tara:strand:+ start:717 stop:1559 length:843 start_codon:yes stop_codon:yes gene_type:complete
MKIALCISGHTRALVEAWRSIEWFMCECYEKKGHTVDIFVYTSDIVSQRKGKMSNLLAHSGSVACPTNYFLPKISKDDDKLEMSDRTFYKTSPQNVGEAIMKVYGDRLKACIVEKEALEENGLSLNQTGSVVNGIQRKPWSWVKKIFEKTYKCNELFKEYCSSTGEKYDIVIRSRTDIGFMKSFSLNPDPGNRIYGFGGWNPGGHNEKEGYTSYFFDGFAYSTPENMDTYCAFYLQEKEDLSAPSGIEAQLHSYLEKNGLICTAIFKTNRKQDRNYIVAR